MALLSPLIVVEAVEFPLPISSRILATVTSGIILADEKAASHVVWDPKDALLTVRDGSTGSFWGLHCESRLEMECESEIEWWGVTAEVFRFVCVGSCCSNTENWVSRGSNGGCVRLTLSSAT